MLTSAANKPNLRPSRLPADGDKSYPKANPKFPTVSANASIRRPEMVAVVEGLFFAGFVGGANLANIDRISLGFESGRSGDVSIGSLSTVPEPASAGLAVLGGLGLLLCRRRF